MVVFYKKIQSDGKKSTERKSDKYVLDQVDDTVGDIL